MTFNCAHLYLRRPGSRINPFWGNRHILMKTIFLGKNCIEVEQTDSTNSYLARLLASDKQVREVFEGTVVIARQQQQGRGQRGTSWESEPGKNLTLSILLQP